MDIILKTKKREISLLNIFRILFIILVFIIGLLLLMGITLFGVSVWMDIFDGGGFSYWQSMITDHSLVASYIGIIFILCLPIVSFGVLILAICMGMINLFEFFEKRKFA